MSSNSLKSSKRSNLQKRRKSNENVKNLKNPNEPVITVSADVFDNFFQSIQTSASEVQNEFQKNEENGKKNTESKKSYDKVKTVENPLKSSDYPNKLIKNEYSSTNVKNKPEEGKSSVETAANQNETISATSSNISNSFEKEKNQVLTPNSFTEPNQIDENITQIKTEVMEIEETQLIKSEPLSEHTQIPQNPIIDTRLNHKRKYQLLPQPLDTSTPIQIGTNLKTNKPIVLLKLNKTSTKKINSLQPGIQIATTNKKILTTKNKIIQSNDLSQPNKNVINSVAKESEISDKSVKLSENKLGSNSNKGNLTSEVATSEMGAISEVLSINKNVQESQNQTKVKNKPEEVVSDSSESINKSDKNLESNPHKGNPTTEVMMNEIGLISGAASLNKSVQEPQNLTDDKNNSKEAVSNSSLNEPKVGNLTSEVAVTEMGVISKVVSLNKNVLKAQSQTNVKNKSKESVPNSLGPIPQFTNRFKIVPGSYELSLNKSVQEDENQTNVKNNLTEVISSSSEAKNKPNESVSKILPEMGAVTKVVSLNKSVQEAQDQTEVKNNINEVILTKNKPTKVVSAYILTNGKIPNQTHLQNNLKVGVMPSLTPINKLDVPKGLKVVPQFKVMNNGEHNKKFVNIQMQNLKAGGKILLQNFNGKTITVGSNQILNKNLHFLSQTNKISQSNIEKSNQSKTSDSVEMKTNMKRSQTILQNLKINHLMKELTETQNKLKFVESSVQTDSKTVYDKSVQTDSTNLLQDLEEDCPNMVDLVEYLIGNPQYSNNIDEAKKRTLINMSKNISFKSQSFLPIKSLSTNSSVKMFDVRRQLFLDLRNCLIPDHVGNMLIHNAILNNNLKLLLRQMYILKLRNVTVNVQNSQGMLPIQLAIINNSDINIVESLLQNGAAITVKDNEGNNLIHLTILYSTTTILDLLMKFARNFNYEKIVNETNDEGLTPLMLAIVERKKEFTEALLKHGSDPNIRDEKSGRSALFHAVENEFDEVISLLLLYKADPKLPNYFGISAYELIRDLGTNKKDILDLVGMRSNAPLDITAEAIISEKINNKKRQTKRTPKEKELRDSEQNVKMTFVPSYKKIKMKHP